VKAVLENVEHRHGVVREAMHVQSFVFTLQVMAYNHRTSNLLTQNKLFLRPPEASPSSKEKAGNQDRPEILYQEYGSPADLLTQVLEGKIENISVV
jgi:hypothetical protein